MCGGGGGARARVCVCVCAWRAQWCTGGPPVIYIFRCKYLVVPDVVGGITYQEEDSELYGTGLTVRSYMYVRIVLRSVHVAHDK